MDPRSRTLKGFGVSPGIAIGKAFLVDARHIPIPFYTLSTDEQVARECARFEEAVTEVERDLETIKQSIHPDLKEQVHILEAHQLILRDRLLYDQTLDLIRRERLNALWALKRSLNKITEIFQSMEDEYVRNRVTDVSSVGERIMNRLAGRKANAFDEIRERVIIVAQDISPADAAQIQLEKTLGFITDMGGRTSHTSIMAGALGIPAIVGAEQATRTIRTGDLLILDGSSGTVVVNPTEEQIGDYYELQDALETYLKEISRKAHLPACTLDGHKINVEANIELLEEVVAAKDHGAEAVGLYRTEFSYMNRRLPPTEEDLYNEYRELAELMAPLPVTMRTLDLGAEKMGRWHPGIEQQNPALGLRAIRLCLHHVDLFKVQLRAILRASAATRNIRLMFPLISGVGELQRSKAILEEVKSELRREGRDFDDKMSVGVMIEVPSAVAVADMLAEEADFFSIGTNDLIQYTLAIDRVNEHVAHLFDPLHPAVLRLIRQVVSTAHKAGIPVTVCGEMAGEPLYVPMLLGLELDSLSMNPQAIPRVKNLLRRAQLSDCRRFVAEALTMRTAAEIREALQDMVLRVFPEEFKFFDPEALQPKYRSSEPYV
ncbi:phosphoenolpyruvate--protein phosphotransferase [Desulfacinum hydrothermale DSM 13146]|uniref:Phosphoenolpyruvate-protein phosphotransferase n=2 Tax=Desulfacinum hydrothermale TaxID=109258 RepID=A0A1W1XVD0_9BACT|nr:phosphoenolpyruvate--protein phosphotransferase [Desulfacinum hydrothermale DSM 13146]